MLRLTAFSLCFFFGMQLSAQTGGGNTGGGQTLEPEFRDSPYERIHGENRRVVPYPHLREADVTKQWRVWREIDLREKMNQVYYYPLTPTNQRKNFITIVRDAVLTNESMTPFDAISDDFIAEITTSDVAAMGAYRDTQMIPDPEPPYELKPKVIDEPFRPETVKKIWLKEDWFFDRQRSVMESRILGICPVMQVFDRTTGEFRYNKPMFWVYFPQARNTFAQEEVYNTNNFGQRLTYDDVFMKRIFASKIRKIDNVHDRRIEEYLKGIHALLRGEEIKDELFTFEHDMWEQ